MKHIPILLYIHIPFCDSKCHYCAFNSYTSLHHLKEHFTKALIVQLKSQLKDIDTNSLQTVFIGGGTPSTLNKEHYLQIFEVLNPYLTNIQEITIEANPNSATSQWLEDIYSLGINRISFGVQSFNDEKLKFLGRNHSSQMAIDAINNASKIGFKHINCDIIYDTALDTKELLDNDLAIVKTLPIDHISAYSLTLEDGTKFYQKTDVRVEDVDMAKYLFDTLEKQGFGQYEISNFAKDENSRSKHNLGYWKYTQYIGAGAGAVGCMDNKRLYSTKDIENYIQNPCEYEEVEELSNQDIKVEKILLGLRCIEGIDKNILNTNELSKANSLLEVGKLRLEDDRYYAYDFLLADELALYIID